MKKNNHPRYRMTLASYIIYWYVYDTHTFSRQLEFFISLPYEGTYKSPSHFPRGCPYPDNDKETDNKQ